MSREKPETLELSPLAVLLGYVLVLMIWLVVFGLLNLFWGNRALISFGEIWHPNPDVLGGLMSVWFIFLWGGGMTLIMGLILINAPRNYFPGEVVAHGMWISLNAGIFEEIIFRWLRFAIAMIMLPFLNFITFGFFQWLYGSILVPVADWATFGALHEWLYHPAGWVVGAAIISANGKFRGAHYENGFFNWVNSWFIGMVMFWLMFNHGLLTAIAAHILYDAIIFAVAAVTTSWRPVAGRSRLALYV